MQTFGALRHTGVNDGEKNAFCNFFVVKTTTQRLTHFPADDFGEIWTQNVNQCLHEFCRSRIICKIFFDKVSATFRGFWGTLTVRAFSLERIKQHVLTLSLPIPLRLYTLPYWSNPPFLIFWHSVTLALSPESQSDRMSKQVFQQEAYPAVRPLLTPTIRQSLRLSPKMGEDLSEMWPNCLAKFHAHR